MAYNEPQPSDQIDESADTASFQRFMEQDAAQGPAMTGGGRGFRLLTLGIGAVVLVVLVVALLQ